MTAESKQRVYVGTYTRRSADQPHRRESIYLCEFDPVSGTLELRGAIADVPNPSFLAISKDEKFLFAVNEEASFHGVDGGGASAFSLDTSPISFINARPTHGESPCYITLDAAQKWALVANYTGGNLTVFPIAENGQLGAAAFIHQNEGHSVNAERQKSAHAHCVIFDPAGRYVLAADLGIDQVLVFRFDAASGHLLPHRAAAVEPGAGPRHLEFHPNGRFLYLVNELNFSVTVFSYDADQGALAHKQTIIALPDHVEGARWGADIHITRSGEFLYASNRGVDCIAAFAVNPQDGTLTLIETVPSGGSMPRNFALDLTENYLLVAHQNSDSIIIFKIDKTTGKLTQTGHALSIPSPVCVKIVE